MPAISMTEAFAGFHAAANATDKVAQEKARTSILSSTADEKQIEAEQTRAGYETALSKHALGKKVLADNPDISLATEQGKKQYIDQMRKNAGNSPELQAAIDKEADENDLALTISLKNKASQEASKQELLVSFLQEALINGTPEDWQKTIDTAPTEYKEKLKYISQMHQSPQYSRMSQEEQSTWDQAVIARFAPAGSKNLLAKMAADQEFKSKKLDLEKAKNETAAKVALERIAASRERNEATIQARDRTDKLLEGLSKEHNLYEDNRRALMTQLEGVDATESHYLGLGKDTPNPEYTKVVDELKRLDTQHAKLVSRYEKKLGNDLPPEFSGWQSPPLPGQVKVNPQEQLMQSVLKAGIPWEPTLYEYQVTPDGKVQRRKKGS